MKFSIGHSGTNAVEIDIDTLLRSRLLVQANSGGGKSYALRKLLEESHGKVQQIVLDPEGEFATLREKFDYVLIGKGGDLAADVRTAGLLAERLLELGASAIIDLYELHQFQRIEFVKKFLDAMVNVDKKYWKPCLVVIDEAHIFCPEKGESVAMQSVIDMCTRGRKRSFCAVLATQRLSKLHKDAAAECNNKLIGRTGLDIDVKRAGEELGITSREEMFKLRQLKPGEFYVFGPAISTNIQIVTIGKVKTTHADVGTKQSVVAPPPAEKVKQILSKLSDLPKEAEEKENTIASYKKEIHNLKMKLKSSVNVIVDTNKVQEMVDRKIEKIKKELNARQAKIADNARYKIQKAIEALQSITLADMLIPMESSPAEPLTTTVRTVQFEKAKNRQEYSQSDKTFGRCERAILSFLVSNRDRSWTADQVAMMTGYSATSGGFKNSLSMLSTEGLIYRSNGSIEWAGKTSIPAGIEENAQFTIDNIKHILGKCEREIFDVFMENKRETELTIEALASATPSGYSPTSGGFKNSISRLCTLGILSRDRGLIKLSDNAKELW